MRILDKYLLRSFLLPFCYCLSAFILLFIIGDLFEHLHKFLRLNNWLGKVLRYYLFFTPSLFVFIIPIAILLGLLYCLGRLQHNQEITAMRASGISIYRVVRPFLLFSLAMSFAVMLINETIVPKALRQSNQLKKTEMGPDGQLEADLADVTYFNPVSNREFYFQSYNPGQGNAVGIKIYERRPDGQTYRLINAAKGAWLDGAWWLFDGLIYSYPPNGPPTKQAFDKKSFDFNVRYEDLIQSKSELASLSFMELKRMLDRKRGFPRSVLRPALVEIHQKLSLPLACFVMGIIGVSFGIRVGRGNLMAGVGASLLLGFLYYVLYSLSVAFGKQGYLSPWLAAWLGNIIFGGTGFYMLYRLN